MEHSDNEPKLIPFTPVVAAVRHDGWTAERQIAFIEALAESACVEDACRHAGMPKASAYRLRSGGVIVSTHASVSNSRSLSERTRRHFPGRRRMLP